MPAARASVRGIRRPGRCAAALGRYLDATLRQFGPQQPQARAVLKALVTAEGTKRASFADEIVARLHSTGLAMTEEAVERDFLRKLVQARLLRVEDIKAGRAMSSPMSSWCSRLAPGLPTANAN